MAAPTETVRSIYEAFARGDIEAVTGAFDERVVWEYTAPVPYIAGTRFIGAGDIVENILARLMVEWENFRVEPVEFITDGGYVVVLAHETGQNRATGERIDVRAAHVWMVNEGRVVSLRIYTDTYQFARAAGRA